MNGPYLLAPASTGIIVVWETKAPVKAEIFYGTNHLSEKRLEVACERGLPWKENTEGICMYRAYLCDLLPDTVYQYWVVLETGECANGTFRTLKAKTNEIHLITLSDSHALDVAAGITQFVLQHKPDFILHSGDISQGTGFQKDQYEQNWFQRCPELLRNMPIVYTDGNHDDGPFFGEYFMREQCRAYHSSPNGLHCSFTYGNTYFAVVNSNQWGLSEMNAVNSNLPVAAKTLEDIEAALKWLKEDLQSEAALEAKWRIVIMHHPYTDNFTNKRAVEILERGHVNLMLSGHLHFYQKAVSINPSIGAGILYITQGSAQDASGEVCFGSDDERILSEYPEVIATGKNVFSTLDITDDKLVITSYGVRSEQHEPFVVDETVLVHDQPQIRLGDAVLAPLEDSPNGFTFTVKALNEGRGLAEAVVALEDNGQESLINLFGISGKERVAVLNPGQEKILSGTIELTVPGTHVIRMCQTEMVFSVPESASEIELNNLNVQAGQSENSDTVHVEVEAVNTRLTGCNKSLRLCVDGEEVLVQKVALSAGERRVISFDYRFEQGGVYQIAVEDLPAKSIEIEGTLKGIPLVRDLSGHENHGLIRGTPKLTKLPEGSMELSLAEYGDYVEIPESQSLRAMQQGFTGMVWANMDRLAAEGEKDHNPLMVKGPSVGWGANYLLRMIVRKNGAAGWGVCYDTNEHSWAGGQVPLGKFAQYMLSFDRRNGGKSYIDNQKVAEVGGISQDTELRYWDAYPIFIGYAYIGHVIKEIKRTKYFTHFPGKVGQVRVYSAALSQQENQEIYEQPGQKGPRAEEMLVWFDFKDIITIGTHVTEWRRPAQFTPAFKADKQLWQFKELAVDTTIPKKASLQAKLELSDDGETVKYFRYIPLQHGQQTISLADLPPAQFVRIATQFDTHISERGTFVPELKLYRIKALRDNQTVNLKWATRAAWERGSFTGAVGFEPLNRTKVIEEYTDVIH